MYIDLHHGFVAKSKQTKNIHPPYILCVSRDLDDIFVLLTPWSLEASPEAGCSFLGGVPVLGAAPYPHPRRRRAGQLEEERSGRVSQAFELQ